MLRMTDQNQFDILSDSVTTSYGTSFEEIIFLNSRHHRITLAGASASIIIITVRMPDTILHLVHFIAIKWCVVRHTKCEYIFLQYSAHGTVMHFGV